MLKFFRRIRRQLLAGGKFKSYLLYASGEIALIVIGILLALQISNWNENLKNRKDEIITLKSIRQEMINNQNQLAHTISSHQKAMDAGYQILSLFQ